MVTVWACSGAPNMSKANKTNAAGFHVLHLTIRIDSSFNPSLLDPSAHSYLADLHCAGFSGVQKAQAQLPASEIHPGGQREPVPAGRIGAFALHRGRNGPPAALNVGHVEPHRLGIGDVPDVKHHVDLLEPGRVPDHVLLTGPAAHFAAVVVVEVDDAVPRVGPTVRLFLRLA